MHAIIEKARKSAGISGMTKNYPDNPKQRGCGFWAAFLGSLSNDLHALDEAEKRHEREKASLAREKAELAKRVADLEHELNELSTKKVRNGVEAVAHAQGWSTDERREAIEKIAG